MDIPWSWVAAGAAVGAGAAVVASVASQREFDQKNKARNFRPEHPPECELDGRNRVALAVCGSVAAVRCPAIAQELVSRGFYVDVIMTEAAAFFLQVDYRGAAPGQALLELAKRTDASGTPLVTAWCDDDEWRGSVAPVPLESVLLILCTMSITTYDACAPAQLGRTPLTHGARLSTAPGTRGLGTLYSTSALPTATVVCSLPRWTPTRSPNWRTAQPTTS